MNSSGKATLEYLFQSTLPVWGATRSSARCTPWREFQSTLPVWGATHHDGGFLVQAVISIHAPRVGSDDQLGEATLHGGYISIHAPRVGSDRTGGNYNDSYDISIHAPRVGSDAWRSPGLSRTTRYFNPRSPCGERRSCWTTSKQTISFQSTLPVWGATSS